MDETVNQSLMLSFELYFWGEFLLSALIHFSFVCLTDVDSTKFGHLVSVWTHFANLQDRSHARTNHMINHQVRKIFHQ